MSNAARLMVGLIGFGPADQFRNLLRMLGSNGRKAFVAHAQKGCIMLLSAERVIGVGHFLQHRVVDLRRGRAQVRKGAGRRMPCLAYSKAAGAVMLNGTLGGQVGKRRDVRKRIPAAEGLILHIPGSLGQSVQISVHV